MTFLPIVERELRVAARQHSTYWMRMVLALAAIAIGLFLYLARTQIPPQSLAKEIFGGLGGLSLLYCLSSGRRSTADCLSEEKREGTLGLLFLTDLKGYDVVLGKLAATSVGAFYGLLAVLPVLAIPLLGGKRLRLPGGGTARAVLFFSALGLGFLFFEIYLIERASA